MKASDIEVAIYFRSSWDVHEGVEKGL